jgi:serpin B
MDEGMIDSIASDSRLRVLPLLVANLGMASLLFVAAAHGFEVSPWQLSAGVSGIPAFDLQPVVPLVPIGSQSAIPRHQRVPLSSEMQSVAQANNRFAFDLFADLRKGREPVANMLISPLSISTALAMTYAGANGQTAEQMADVMHIDSLGNSAHVGFGGWLADLNTERDGYELNIVNRLFAQEGMQLKAGFLDTTSMQYNAPVEELDFVASPEPARQHINAWVAENTNDRIRDLLPQGAVTPSTRLVLTNAVYFNGDWKHEFDEQATRDTPFHIAGGETVEVPTMQQQHSYRYGQFDGYQMLELPYAGDDLSMVVVVPDELDGLGDLEQQLTASEFETSVASLAMRDVIVELPKFTFGDESPLTESLQQLGMKDAFGNADFSNLADGDLAISGVFHKTFIDVSERGTEAAGATAVVVGTTSVVLDPPPPVLFRADRSFLFAIRDRHTGGVMFLGRMAEPEISADGVAAVPEPPNCIQLVLVVALAGLAVSRCRGNV